MKIEDTATISYDSETKTFTVEWQSLHSKRTGRTAEQTKKHFAAVIDDMQESGDLEIPDNEV